MASPVPKFQYRRRPDHSRWNDLVGASKTARASQGRNKVHSTLVSLSSSSLFTLPHSFQDNHTLVQTAMISTIWFPSLALLAVTVPAVKGQRNTCASDEPGRRGGECIRGQGREYASAFCSSFLPITTPVQTSFTTVTEYGILHRLDSIDG